MPTSPHRPFFSSFLAAFRAHSSPTASASSLTTSKSPATVSSSTTSNSNTASHPRSITSTAKPGATTSALTQLHSPRSANGGTSPLSASPGYAGASYMNSNPVYANSSNSAATQAAREAARERVEREQRFRRGSDSSSDGFRDVLGAEKWYIGGRTQGGEERFFKLGVVKRERSVDRLSLDRLSL